MDAYSRLILEVDALSARLSHRYRVHLACRAGCSSCCNEDISVFEVEAESIGEAFRTLPVETREEVLHQAEIAATNGAGQAPAPCPFLIGDRCAIYDSRPLICRTQGLPLLYSAEDGVQEVDFCPLNFTAPGATDCIDEAYLVPLEDINEQLVMANLGHCRSKGQLPADSGRRTRMSEIILRPANQR